MKHVKAVVCALALFLAVPVIAQSNTYYGGFEDTTGVGSDYDYNDLVFSLTGNGLTLDSSGVWHSPAGLVLDGSPYPSTSTPFWNNGSQDGSSYNVGFCIYGGGTCNGGVALDAGADYLATALGGSVNDVYFSVNGAVNSVVSVMVTADTDDLGWAPYNSTTHTVGTATMLGNSLGQTYQFTPNGDFVLVGEVTPPNSNSHTYYDSYTSATVSQFAFFGSPTPEPGSLMLLGTGLLGTAGIARRRFLRK